MMNLSVTQTHLRLRSPRIGQFKKGLLFTKSKPPEEAKGMQHSGYCWIDIEIFVSKFKGI
ncbi:hypothetical protein JV33_04050 [Pectobacterium carotovorum subsp. carotovorum]|nr:hypothetical protein JV33_04050 [Pectobacterium carotovorum subsp. carotovorum]KML72159.1 hypothetical protein G032_03565 [Pectobacterium carotovorum subsp. carotovorum ICMP 5702]